MVCQDSAVACSGGRGGRGGRGGGRFTGNYGYVSGYQRVSDFDRGAPAMIQLGGGGPPRR